MAQTGAHGNMDIEEQRETFHGFLMATVWSCCLLAQTVALLTLGFAIGAGWWAGLIALIVIGVGIGLIFKLGGVFWAVQIATWVLLILGGLIVPAFSGLAG